MLSSILKVGRFSWYLFSGLLIVFALLAASARWLLLNIDDHSGWVESWLSRTLERPVDIGELQGHWRGWSPSIRIDDLTIYEQDRTAALIRFRKAQVELAVLESLAHKDLRPARIILSGIKFTLKRDQNGVFSIAGMPPSRWPVAQWIEAQKRFDLTDAHIDFVDQKRGEQTHLFTDLKLSIQRDGDMRYISGETRRKAASTETWRFDIAADQSVLESGWDGRINLAGDNIDASLLRTVFANEALAVDGSFKLSLTSAWRDAKLRDANFQADLSLMPASAASVSTQASDSTGPLAAVVEGSVNRRSDGWSLGAHLVEFATENYPIERYPTLKVQWNDSDPDLVWQISELKIQDLSRLASEYFVIDALEELNIRNLDPRGLITSASMLSSRERPLIPTAGSANFRRLSWQEHGDIPAVNGLGGLLSFNQRGGSFQFTPNQEVTLSTDKWLEGPVKLGNIVGRIDWQKNGGGLVFRSERLTTKFESIDIESRGSVSLTAGATPNINILSRINTGALADIRKFVPKNVLPVKGERWARRAFKSGEINNGMMLFRGNMADFPFDDHQGIFQVHIDADKADVKYGAKWPLAKSVGGSFFVENRSVEFTVQAGRIYSSDVSDSKISIDNLFTRQRYVQVSGKSEVIAPEVSRFIDETPLKNTKAKRFKEITISDPFEIELDLNLGIFPGGEKDVLGVARFAGNRIESRTLKLALDELKGDVSFTRHDWYGEGLAAMFRGNRVGVLLDGGLDDPSYDTQIRLTGTSNADFIRRQIDEYVPRLSKIIRTENDDIRLAGSTAWKAVISLPSRRTPGQDAPKKLYIESSLAGLAIDLPWPLSKHQAQTVPFAVEVARDPSGTRDSRLSFGERFEAVFREKTPADAQAQLLGAEVIFGQPEQTPTIDGQRIMLRGRLTRLDLQMWRGILANSGFGKTQNTAQLPASIDLQIDDAIIFQTSFSALNINAKRLDDGWLTQLDGPQIGGEISVPDNHDLPINLDFARLYLPKREKENRTSNYTPSDLRPFKLESLSTRYGDIEFGKVTIAVERIDDGISITEALSEHGDFELRARGKWQTLNASQYSHFNVKLRGDSLANLLGRFGYDIVNIEGGATELEFNAHWDGSPLAFGLEKLRGHLSIGIESGRFLDIEPGGGRLFGLLSLQTLPRRLSLDFNDLFSKGFTFDKIVGNFSIDQGNAYTNSLLMDGPSARIQISGRTGLKDQDYDQRVTVTPALSNSIPVASALFGPAGVGVGAVIYLGQKMFKSIPEQMDKFLSREYSITGAWSAPVIERI